MDIVWVLVLQIHNNIPTSPTTWKPGWIQCTLVTLKVFGLAFQFLEYSTSIRKELLAHSSMHIYICWYWQQTLNYTRRIGLITMAFNFYLSLISWPMMDILQSIRVDISKTAFLGMGLRPLARCVVWNLKSRNMEVLWNAHWYGRFALVLNPSAPFSELLALNPFSPPSDVAMSFLFWGGYRNFMKLPQESN